MERWTAWNRARRAAAAAAAVAASALLAGCGGGGAASPSSGVASANRTTERSIPALRSAIADGGAAVVHPIPPDAPRFPVGGAVQVAGGRWQARTGDGAWSRHALWRPIRHAALAGSGLLAIDEDGRVWRFPSLEGAPVPIGGLPPSTVALMRGTPPRGHRALVLPHRDGAVVVDPVDGIEVVDDAALTVAVELEGRLEGNLVARTVDGTVMRRRRGEPDFTRVDLGAPALGLGLLEGRTMAFLARTRSDDARPGPPFPRAVPMGELEGGALAVDLGTLAVDDDRRSSGAPGTSSGTAEPARSRPPPLGQRAWAHAVPVGDALLVLDPARRAPAFTVVDGATLDLHARRLLLPGDGCGEPFPLGPDGAGVICEASSGDGTALYRSDRLSAFRMVDLGSARPPVTRAPAVRSDGGAIAWVARGCDGADPETSPRVCVAAVDDVTDESLTSWALGGAEDDPSPTIGGWDASDHVLGGSTLVELGTGATRAVRPAEGWAFEGTPRLTSDGVLWATARAAGDGPTAPEEAVLLVGTTGGTAGDPVILSPWPGTLPDGWRDVAVLEEGMLVAAGPSGVWRTADGGRHWTALAPPQGAPDAFPDHLRLGRCDRRGCLALPSPAEGRPGGGVLIVGDPMSDVRSPPGPLRVHLASTPRSRDGAPDPGVAKPRGEEGARAAWTLRSEPPSPGNPEDPPTAAKPPAGGHVASTRVAAGTSVTLAFAPVPTGLVRWDLYVRWRLGGASSGTDVLARPFRVWSRLGTALGAGDWGALVHVGPVGGPGALHWVRAGGDPRAVPVPETLDARPVGMGVTASGTPQIAFPTVDPSWGGSRRLDLARFDPREGDVTVIRALTLDAGTVLGRPWSPGAGGGLVLWDAAGRAHRVPPAGPPRRWPDLDRSTLARMDPCTGPGAADEGVWRVIADVVSPTAGAEAAGTAGHLAVDALEIRVTANRGSACLVAVRVVHSSTTGRGPPAGPPTPSPSWPATF